MNQRVEKDLALMKGEHEKAFALLDREFTVLLEWKADQKKQKEEWGRRLWSFGPNAIGAVITVLLSALAAYLASRP